MCVVSHLVWSLVGASAYLGAIAGATGGVLDIGLVFPRQNETYAPMERFPFVFALQNAKLAENLRPLIELNVLNASMSMLDKVVDREFDLIWANYSTEPYFVYGFADFRIEGPLRLLWKAWWRNCDESGDEVSIVSNSSDRFVVNFDIRQGAPTADVVATTAEEDTCPGLTIEVTDKTHDVPEPLSGINKQWGMCAVVASSSPTPTANPCRVKIDEATVESMKATELERWCRKAYPPPDCPEKDQAVQKLAIAGGATFAAVLGVAAFLFA
ncbi:hypothetical protein CkaCkLH20_06613 [Colletotrichum karsti]|uniref:DUF7136 domain-containing protein n=1 Tax=Colletotrichum karsti TaxID=1095194 RepID=A0A9P6I5X7_9PEZI|nr:uncharacterized protein CkaCkLH20_06613 [Colletotrichum karsti]KAF9875681.1 hypothetical protein CkaCkLH20_06613 [Colletotrichum karsti]